MKDVNFKFCLLFFALIIVGVSCGTTKPDIKKIVIKGKVFSINQQPINNVIIRNGIEEVARSKKDGSFSLIKSNIKSGDVLIFENEGFVKISRVYKDNSSLDIFMKKRAKPLYFSSKEARNIILDSGMELKVQQNAFVIKGKPYTGMVQFTATHFDVLNRDDLRSSPGLFIAEQENGDELVPLNSFGVLEIVAMSKDNIPLELKKGIGIGVGFPIISENTPTKVNLYSLNTLSGYWSLQGSLFNENNQLLGVVTSVNSAWNADDPCATQLMCVTVKVVDSNGNPIVCGVEVVGVSYQGYDGIYTPDSNGDVQFMVCPDSVIELGACWSLCCGPGVPLSDPCCNNPQFHETIDLSTITANPTGCTDIGTWVVP